MTLITAVPGLIALLVCIRRGPERALVDVYLPTLLFLPDSFHWMIVGHLSFNDTAIIPIAVFLIARPPRRWEWSFTDFLIASYLVLSILSEYVNKDFYLARNIAFQLACSTLFPYLAAKGLSQSEDSFSAIAKRLVGCLTITALASIYEFRMGRSPFTMLLSPFFPGQFSAVWQLRYGVLRPSGPYGHSIIAGLIFAIGYRFTQWLKSGNYWPGTLPVFRISKIRFCGVGLILGSLLTLSRGPWLGAGIAAVVVGIGGARSRKRAIATAVLLMVLVGIPSFQFAKSYVWIEPGQGASEMQESAAYRHALIQKYIVIVQERPMWGWGRNGFPTIDGMVSVDNYYLLLALTSGELVFALFVAILVWIIIRLVAFCHAHHGSVFPGSIALALLGSIIIIALSTTTVALYWQAVQLFFLIVGWSESILLRRVQEKPYRVPEEASPSFQLARVMV
jgi:hypothetical protein